MKDGRLSLRDVAKVAGVSHATVSMALRDHHALPVATRQRIKAVARKLGYRPDPMLTSLNLYRQSKRAVQYQATLAWLDTFPHRNTLRAISGYDLYYQGAVERAAELGYKIEEFWMHENGMTEARLARILKARQIQGILLPPLKTVGDLPDLPWKHFSVVTFGFSHLSPFHVIAAAQYRGAKLATQKLRELGYKRVGFYCWEELTERTDGNFSAGFMAESFAQGVPPLLLYFPKETSPEEQRERLLAWVRESRLDALLSPDNRPLEWLRQAGFRIPGDIAVALLNDPVPKRLAGIDQMPKLIGRVAVENLIGLIQMNKTGKPEFPLEILVEPQWIDGESAPGPGRGNKSPLGRGKSTLL